MPDREEKAGYVAGCKQTGKAIRSGAARTVLLARDADPAVTGPLLTLCRQRGVPVRWVETMQSLGHTCALPVGAAAAALLRGPEDGFSDRHAAALK